LNDSEREVAEERFKQERLEFQLQMKQDAVAQARDQLRRSEAAFKEEVERVRLEYMDRLSAGGKTKVPYEAESKV